MKTRPPSPRTLRLDYFHTGGSTHEVFSLDEVVGEPASWPGRVGRAEDVMRYGEYGFDARDAATANLIFSGGFGSIFNEWSTTDEPTKVEVLSPGTRQRDKTIKRELYERAGVRRKFDMARDAVRHAIRLLTPRDHFALVIYDHDADTLLPRTAATEDAKARAIARLDHVDARGNTNLGGGWEAGLSALVDRATGNPTEGDVVRRVLLLTDGLANAGVTDHDALAAIASTWRTKGITTSTFGLGADFDETLLSRIATDAGGHFYFIEDARQIPDYFTSELGDALEVVARDARLNVTVADDEDVTVLNEFVSERARDSQSVRLGDLVAGQQLTVVLAIRTPARETGKNAAIAVSLTDADNALFRGAMPVDWRAVDASTNDAQPVNVDVLVAVAGLLAARARTEALALDRAQNAQALTRLLVDVAAAIEALAPNTPALHAIAQSLRRDIDRFAFGLSVHEMKTVYYQSYAERRSRSESGKVKKRA